MSLHDRVFPISSISNSNLNAHFLIHGSTSSDIVLEMHHMGSSPLRTIASIPEAIWTLRVRRVRSLKIPRDYFAVHSPLVVDYCGYVDLSCVFRSEGFRHGCLVVLLS